MYYLLALGFGLITLGLLWLLDKKFKANMTIVMKVISVVLIVLLFVWYLLPGHILNSDSTFSGNYLRGYTRPNFRESGVIELPQGLKDVFGSSATQFTIVICVFAIWAFIILHTITVLVPFFTNFKIAKKIEKFVSPILIVFDIAVIPNIVKSFAGNGSFSVIGLLISLEMGLILGKLVFSFIFVDHDFTLRKHEIAEFIASIFVLIVFSMPFYVPQVLFGKFILPEPSMGAMDFNTFHRAYIIATFVYMIGLTVLLRNRKGEYSRMVLLYICFAAMINYGDGESFRSFLEPWSYPLHICNTAMFILPIALSSKSEKVFYFTFFINILGAFLAIFMPSYDSAAHFMSYRPIQFWTNHIEAATMPFICVLLSVFKRPTKKQFFYSMVGFFFYYVLVLLLNTILTGYLPIYTEKTGHTYGIPDFFFINSDFVAKKVHMEFLLENFKLEFDIGRVHLKMYPLYQAIYFGGFIIMSIGMWFVYAWVFKAQDALIRVHDRYRKVRFDEIALCQKYNKKEISQCMSEISKDKLVVSRFSKRYNEKAPFAVKDINFEAKGGEIIGFLGPNGAGKSTTIKAIVGIHLPTEGTIEINGYDIVTQPVQAKAQLGFVPDHYALYENLTGREYLNYIADLYDVSKEDRDAFLEEFLDSLQMRAAIDNKMQTYSHGMKQKIAIMASIIHNPKLWILDEPLTGLDPVSIFQVKQCLKHHAEKGNIVFFSSHLIDIVEKLCDRIVIISDHKVQDIANVHELLEQGVNLEQYYMQKTGLVTGDK